LYAPAADELVRNIEDAYDGVLPGLPYPELPVFAVSGPSLPSSSFIISLTSLFLAIAPYSGPVFVRDIAERLESPGTKVYSTSEARELFDGVKNIHVQTIVTRYDLRVGRRSFLPAWLRHVVPSQLGWFMVVNGNKGS